MGKLELSGVHIHFITLPIHLSWQQDCHHQQASKYFNKCTRILAPLWVIFLGALYYFFGVLNLANAPEKVRVLQEKNRVFHKNNQVHHKNNTVLQRKHRVLQKILIPTERAICPMFYAFIMMPKIRVSYRE